MWNCFWLWYCDMLDQYEINLPSVWTSISESQFEWHLVAFCPWLIKHQWCKLLFHCSVSIWWSIVIVLGSFVICFWCWSIENAVYYQSKVCALCTKLQSLCQIRCNKRIAVYSFNSSIFLWSSISAHLPFISTSLSPSLSPFSPCANIKSLSSHQAHVVFLFQPMNKLSKTVCLAPWKTLALPFVGDRNKGPHARGRARAIVCFPVQSAQRFQGSVLSLAAPYAWTELGSERFQWLDLTQTHEQQLQQLQLICGWREFPWSDGVKDGERSSLLWLITLDAHTHMHEVLSDGQCRSHKVADQ